MKVLSFPYAQGDLNIFEITEIPDDLTPAKLDAGQYTLAHSETGHHHVIDGNTVRVFDQDEFTSYMEVSEPSNIVHMRGFDTHETIPVTPGNYLLTRQREYIPEGFRRAAD
jgi:hypothetical protein